MPKRLGPKSVLIRNAIAANPGMGNTELAKMLNDADDKVKVTAQEVGTQRQSMKRAGTTTAAYSPAAKPARKKPGRKPVRPAAEPVPVRATAPATANDGTAD